MSKNGMPSEDTPRCNGRLRRGENTVEETVDPGRWAGKGYCQRLAGEGTNHKGEGRCRLHGGKSGRTPSHGLYSGRRDDLQDRFEQAFGDDKIGSMRAEIAALKALLSDFWERIEEVDGDTIDAATKLQSEIRKSLDTASKIQDRHAPTEEEIEALVTGFAAIIETYVPESKRSDALNELESIAGNGRPRALESGRSDD